MNCMNCMMRGFDAISALGIGRVATPWTCRRCALQARGGETLKQIKGYATRVKRPRPQRKARVLLAATGGAMGAGALAFTDDLKHAYKAAERSGRVASTLFVCINE
jgi:aarF domain-containing kinase